MCGLLQRRWKTYIFFTQKNKHKIVFIFWLRLDRSKIHFGFIEMSLGTTMNEILKIEIIQILYIPSIPKDSNINLEDYIDFLNFPALSHWKEGNFPFLNLSHLIYFKFFCDFIVLPLDKLISYQIWPTINITWCTKLYLLWFKKMILKSYMF